jgi:hypothetical protein
VFLALVCSTTYSAVWEVPSAVCPTVQAGIDSAAFGDTVLVLPGSYNENLVMKDGVVLLGRDGWPSTFLQPEAAGPPIISCTHVGSTAEITGFTVRNGRSYDGAGIHCVRSSPRIALNYFNENIAENVGGAIACFEMSDATLEENIFRANRAGYMGGGVYCDSSGPAIGKNEFLLNHGEWGGAIASAHSATPDIRDNLIHRNTCNWQGGGIYARWNCNLVIEDNVINLNVAGGSGGGMFIQHGSHADVRRNLVARNEADHGGCIHITGYASALIENNTVYNCTGYGPSGSSGITAYNGSTIEVYNCIVTKCWPRPAISCEVGSTGILDCNCVWDNAVDYSGCTPGANDFSEDPLFCNAVVGDFTLQSCSPCATGYGCGLVGAFGVGCDCGTTATTPCTWGSIKAAYR